MSRAEINFRQLSHDLRSLIEPLETAEMMCKVNKPEQAMRIQSGAIKAIKKMLADIEKKLGEVSNQEKMNE